MGGAYRIDLETGEISRILSFGPDEGIMGTIYGPDANYFFVYGNIEQGFSSWSRVRDIESGEERELYRFPEQDMYPNIALSPDNRWLSSANTGWGAVRSLRIMPASGGAAREVWRFGEVEMGIPNISHIWDPDGRIILSAHRTRPTCRTEICGGCPLRAANLRRWDCRKGGACGA